MCPGWHELGSKYWTTDVAFLNRSVTMYPLWSKLISMSRKGTLLVCALYEAVNFMNLCCWFMWEMKSSSSSAVECHQNITFGIFGILGSGFLQLFINWIGKNRKEKHECPKFMEISLPIFLVETLNPHPQSPPWFIVFSRLWSSKYIYAEWLHWRHPVVYTLEVLMFWPWLYPGFAAAAGIHLLEQSRLTEAASWIWNHHRHYITVK